MCQKTQYSRIGKRGVFRLPKAGSFPGSMVGNQARFAFPPVSSDFLVMAILVVI